MISKIMKTKRHNSLIAMMVMISVITVGCGDSVSSPEDNVTTTVTLKGQITDAVTGEAIVGAKIDIGSWSATTDENGYYTIGNVPADSGGGVSKEYQATIVLTGVTAPVDMTDTSISPRYPDRKFTSPISGDSIISSNHNFKVGKLSASIRGWTGNQNRAVVGGATIELQDNTVGREGIVLQTAISDMSSAEFNFINIESGVDYTLMAYSADNFLQGSVDIDKLNDNELFESRLGGQSELILTSDDSYSPKITSVSPENNADISPGAVDVVLTFNETIYQDEYSTPNPLATSSNIYYDIDVSYGGHKASGNLAHTLSWNASYDKLTISIPSTGVSSKYTVDLSLLSPVGDGDARVLGKLKDYSGNGLEDSPVLENGSLLSFTTNGGVSADIPAILSPNAAGMDSAATSVTIDWLPASGATNGYNVYRSVRNDLPTGINEPFIKIAALVTESLFTDTQVDTGFSLLLSNEIAQYYVYRVTSVNSDYIESDPSNELTIRDVVAPTPDVASASQCVSPGGNSLIMATSDVVDNGQIEITFSEALDAESAQALANYTGSNLASATLNTPSTVVIDFSVPIVCANTETIVIGTGVLDVAGNALSGTTAERTVKYVP